MAHRGMFYRVNQDLRIYNLFEDWPFWVPHQVRCTVQSWAGSGAIALPTAPTIGIAELFSGGPPAYSFEYRTPNLGTGGYTLELGFIDEVQPDHQHRSTTFQVWVNGVAQLNTTTANWIHVWLFDALVDRGHLAGADLWPSPIGPSLEAVVW